MVGEEGRGRNGGKHTAAGGQSDDVDLVGTCLYGLVWMKSLGDVVCVCVTHRGEGFMLLDACILCGIFQLMERQAKSCLVWSPLICDIAVLLCCRRTPGETAQSPGTRHCKRQS